MRYLFIGTILAVVLTNSVALAQAKRITIQGKVAGFDNSLPLEGAGIVVKGTTNATGTQADGTFNLTLEAKDSILVISLAGYQTEEVKITSATDYNIFLKQAGILRATQKENRSNYSLINQEIYAVLCHEQL